MDHAADRVELLNQLAQARAELSGLLGEQGAWLDLDITMGQLRTMVFLIREQPTFVSDVSKTLCISRPAASAVVDRLVQLNMIDRTEDQADRRRTRVALTSRGHELVDQLLNGPMSVRDSIRRLPLPDLAALAQGTSALVRQIRSDLQITRPADNGAATQPEPIVCETT